MSMFRFCKYLPLNYSSLEVDRYIMYTARCFYFYLQLNVVGSLFFRAVLSFCLAGVIVAVELWVVINKLFSLSFTVVRMHTCYQNLIFSIVFLKNIIVCMNSMTIYIDNPYRKYQPFGRYSILRSPVLQSDMDRVDTPRLYQCYHIRQNNVYLKRMQLWLFLSFRAIFRNDLYSNLYLEHMQMFLW